ncbi:MAG: ribose 5-phosphate isomerase B [Candidatus Eisenbacteria bacterium]
MSRDRLRELVREAVREAGASPRGEAVAIGADHGGYSLKERLKNYLTEELRMRVMDCGTHSADPVDYPDIAEAVGRRVSAGECGRGLLIDGAGIGSAIAANKIPGVRAAVCHDARTAVSSRSHNDANVLCIGAGLLPIGEARRLVRLFLATPFAGGRHARRVEKISALDRTRALRADEGSAGR